MKLLERLEKRSNLCKQPYEVLLARRKYAFEYCLIDLINTLAFVAGGLYLYWVDMPHLGTIVFISSIWWFVSALDDRRRVDWIDFIIMNRMNDETK